MATLASATASARASSGPASCAPRGTRVVARAGATVAYARNERFFACTGRHTPLALDDGDWTSTGPIRVAGHFALLEQWSPAGDPARPPRPYAALYNLSTRHRAFQLPTQPIRRVYLSSTGVSAWLGSQGWRNLDGWGPHGGHHQIFDAPASTVPLAAISLQGNTLRWTQDGIAKQRTFR